MFSLGSAIIVFALCLLYFVNPAVSTKCYDCSVMEDADCILNPKQAKFAVNCTDTYSGNFADIMGNLNIGSFTGKKNVTEFQCFNTILQYTNKTINRTIRNLLRKCIDKALSCDQLKSALWPVELATCELCDTDLCNSSSIISAGLYSLIIPLAMLFAFCR